MRYYCKCGVYFDRLTDLRQHIGILNPHWPKTTPEDEHKSITREEWSEQHNAAYRRLRDGE